MPAKISTPGFTGDLGPAGREAWQNYILRLLNGDAQEEGAIKQATKYNDGVAPALVLDGDPSLLPGTLPIDWKGFPVRVMQTLVKPKATLDPFIDWSPGSVTHSRAVCHEEYLEWRTLRRADGKVVRIEFTTETPDYWATLAHYEPRRLVELAARFSGETVDKVDIAELFGTSVDPFSITPGSPAGCAIETQYKLQNWSSKGRIKGAYNNGTKAMMHMAIPQNTTSAAVYLAVFAAYAHGKQVGAGKVPLSGPEAIQATVQSAVNCRNSDPTIVGAAISTVFSGATIALMEAIGLYILTSPNEIGLTFADGTPVPSTWFSRQRGTDNLSNPVGLDLFQRLVIEAPPGSNQTVGDLLDADSDPITSGTQVARHINVALHVRKTADGAANPLIVAPPLVPPCNGQHDATSNFENLWEEYSADAPAPTFVMLRGGNVHQ